jgi:hypothetical protein
VVLARQAPVGTPDLASGRVASDTQHPVEVRLLTHRSHTARLGRSRPTVRAGYLAWRTQGGVIGEVSKGAIGLLVKALVLGSELAGVAWAATGGLYAVAVDGAWSLTALAIARVRTIASRPATIVTVITLGI